MDLTISGIVKMFTLIAILAVFALVGWRFGAPNSFNAVLADAGIAQPVAPAAAAPATSTPAPAPAPAAAPTAEPAKAPTPASSDSSAGH